MIRFTVTWLQHAQDQLAELWIDRPYLRDAITAAAAKIDVELARDPEQKGTVSSGMREIIVYPLAVLFSIREEDRLVEVADVHDVLFQSNGAVS
ncbi:MAG TPA: hypothetical protein VMG10_04135 [Gemmataceae bacterium]|nr:hypothetical protein [Gemmataceae bacterium]